MTPIEIKIMNDEIRILKAFNKQTPECINLLVDTIKTKNNFYIIKEYNNCGSLKSLLEEGLNLTVKEIAIIFNKVLKALQIIHSLGIIHRNLSIANILINII